MAARDDVVLTIKEGIRKVNEYQLSSTKVRPDIRSLWTKERVISYCHRIYCTISKATIHHIQMLNDSLNSSHSLYLSLLLYNQS